MPKICYMEQRFRSVAIETIESANAILEEYQDQGFRLTLRQLYYQFVARGKLENTERNYKNLGNIISRARVGGLIDWFAIEDRTRHLRSNAHWESPAEIVQSCARQFRIDKWAGQTHRLEVWIEKDALVGVIENQCRKLDVPFFSCRGYTSQSELWSASQRLVNGREPVILHLGDHDPSGIDMSRDIQERMALFGCEVTFHRLALNMDQVEELGPPPNPAKITDSRASSYIRRFGRKSWELDALEPRYINDLVLDWVLHYRDEERWKIAEGKEADHRRELRRIASNL